MKARRLLLLCLAVCEFITLPHERLNAQVELKTSWVRHYDGPPHERDEAVALCVDGDGYVYVTGESEGIGTGDNYATVKYAPDGSPMWVARYDHPTNPQEGNLIDRPKAIGIDATGSVYVTGYSWGGNALWGDFATVKYASTGTELWVRRYVGAGGSNDFAEDLSVDSFGHVYVTGTSENNMVTVKYDTSGVERWVRSVDGVDGGWAGATRICVDANGNVFTLGWTETSSSGTDLVTQKYDSSGSAIWTHVYGGGSAGDDYPADIEVDAAGGVLITGFVTVSFSDLDFATYRLDATGVLVWDRLYDDGTNGQDRPIDLETGMDGSVCVSGTSRTPAGQLSFTTLKYDSAGALLWAKTYDGSPGFEFEEARGLRVHTNGTVYVTGTITDTSTQSDLVTVLYDPNGQEMSTHRFHSSADAAAAMELDSFGNVYVTGSSVVSPDPSTFNYLTVKFAPCSINSPGDVNGDGVVNLLDVVLLGNYLDGLIDESLTCVDTNGDLDGDDDLDEDDYDLLYEMTCP